MGTASPSVPIMRVLVVDDDPLMLDCVLSKPPKLRDLREALSLCASSGIVP